MTVRSWLTTCSSTSFPSTAFPPNQLQLPSPNLFASDTSSCSEIQTSSSASQETSCSSPRSNHSLQSLPSIPSLQTTCPETTQNNVSVYVSSLKPQTNQVISCLAVSGDLLYAASGNEINVFTLSNYQHIDTFNDKDSSSGSIKSVAFGEGKVFTAHQDCKIRVWLITPTKCHQLMATIPTVKDRLRRLVLPKNYVQVRRHKKRLWIEHVDAISDLAMTDGLLYSVSWDKSLKIWRTSNLRCLESVKAHEDAVNAMAVSADGTVYTASADKRIRVWGRGRTTQEMKSSSRKQRHGLIATLEKHHSGVNALALSSDGSTLFSGACDRSILVWEREDNGNHMGVTGAMRGHKGAILCLINVSDILVSGSEDRTVRVWRRGGDQRYSCMMVLEGHERPVKSLVAVMEGTTTLLVCSGSLDGEIRVWQVTVSNFKTTSPSCTSDSDLTNTVFGS
ncbi:protein JINGUBANG-like [Telopea speciosissima]|uniref:protein JINGUBANG-like n=1 Tax=Telopea speciosissima TaxID=54955 RepID=UPI001CC79A2E|nr:protein JINGUBANG-like [Telopea speciosissima]